MTDDNFLTQLIKMITHERDVLGVIFTSKAELIRGVKVQHGF